MNEAARILLYLLMLGGLAFVSLAIAHRMERVHLSTRRVFG